MKPDHRARSYELIARAFAGHEEGLTRDGIPARGNRARVMF